MASLPANDAAAHHGADIVDHILLIPAHEIVAGDRLRAIDAVWASALGQLMQRDGQQTPIEVCRLPGQRHWTLVAGAHRHAGAVAAGLAYLRAIQVSAGRDERRLREVNENLWRKDLEPIDRAAFMAEAVAIHKRQAGTEADRARERHVPTNLDTVSRLSLNAEAADTLDTMSNVYGWSDEVAEQLGFCGRTVRRDLYLYRRLAPSLVSRLREARHPVARNASQLRALAKLDDQQQARVVEKLLAGAKRVADALPAQRASAPEDKRLSAFIGAFQRMSLSEKKGALEHLRPLLPAGFALGVAETADLNPLIALITDQLDQELDPDWIVGKLEAEHGARVRFSAGTYELKLAKVAATCTAGGDGLLRAWIRAAERRLSAGAR